MKSLVACLCVLISGTSFANTITPLSVPLDVPKGNQPSGRVCVATTFNADDSSNGTCTSVTAGACSGRACQPTYTSKVYVAKWDTEGNVISDGFCGTLVSHVPALHVWTYAPGFDASTCYLPAEGSPQISVYDPRFGFNLWFGYVTTSTDGTYELLTYGLSGFINQF